MTQFLWEGGKRPGRMRDITVPQHDTFLWMGQLQEPEAVPKDVRPLLPVLPRIILRKPEQREMSARSGNPILQVQRLARTGRPAGLGFDRNGDCRHNSLIGCEMAFVEIIIVERNTVECGDFDADPISP